MAGGKLNARQKMINLMYLVFIAMMALNIDREVLSSFYNIDQSLVKTNTLTDSNNQAFMGVIESRAKDDPEYKTTEMQAKSVHEKAQEVIQYLEGVKTELRGTEPIMDEDGALNYAALSNLEGVTSLFFISDSEPTETGTELVSKLQGFNTYLDELSSGSKSDSTSRGSLDFQRFKLDIENNVTKGSEKRQSWLHKTFYGQPQIAAVTTITKLQNDVYNAETEIIRSFLTTKMLDDIEINTFKGVISSPGILQTGQTVTTYAALGAFDNGINGTATVNGKTYQVTNGQASIPITASAPGDYTLQGSMSFQKTDKNGKVSTETVPLDPVTYKVVDEVIVNKLPFMGVITADKMNVLYVGLDNPLSATVSGVQPNSITLSGPGVRSTGGGKGSIKPSSVGNITLKVSGKTSDGQSVSKDQVFRVRPLPRPVAVTNRGKAVQSLPASSLSGLSVKAKMPDDFAFELSVNVTGFKVKVPGKAAQKVNGSSLSGASVIAGAKAGTTVTIFDIETTSSAPVGNTENNIIIEVL